jgi:hypothetical protein
MEIFQAVHDANINNMLNKAKYLKGMLLVVDQLAIQALMKVLPFASLRDSLIWSRQAPGPAA